MEPNNQNSYDFILNSDQKKAAGPNFAGPQKILMILGLFTGVIIIIIILLSLVSSSGNNNRQNLVSLSAHQTELLRILDLGVKDVEDPSVQQKFQTLLTTTNSDAQEVNSLIVSREIEVTPIEKSAQKDSSVDDELKAAKERKDFDPAFEAAANELATEYFRALQTAFSSAATPQEKDILNRALLNVQTIAE
jgi:hypothetical protein